MADWRAPDSGPINNPEGVGGGPDGGTCDICGQEYPNHWPRHLRLDCPGEPDAE